MERWLVYAVKNGFENVYAGGGDGHLFLKLGKSEKRGGDDASCQGGTKKATEADEQQNQQRAQSATVGAEGPMGKRNEGG